MKLMGLYDWSGLCVCHGDYCKSNQSISVKLDVTIKPTNGKNRLTFGGDPVPDTDSGSLFRSLCTVE